MACSRYHGLWLTDQKGLRQPLYRPLRISAARSSVNLSANSKMVLAGNRKSEEFLTLKLWESTIVRKFSRQKNYPTLRPWEIQMLYILTLRPWETSHFIFPKLDNVQITFDQNFATLGTILFCVINNIIWIDLYWMLADIPKWKM